MKNVQRHEVDLSRQMVLQFNFNYISQWQSAIFIKLINHFHYNSVSVFFLSGFASFDRLNISMKTSAFYTLY